MSGTPLSEPLTHLELAVCIQGVRRLLESFGRAAEVQAHFAEAGQTALFPVKAVDVMRQAKAHASQDEPSFTPREHELHGFVIDITEDVLRQLIPAH